VNGDQSSGAFLFLGTQNSRRSSLTKSLKPDSAWAGSQRSTVTGTVWIVEIRTTVFSWTPTRFPFHTGTAKKLTFGQSPIITVIGKAFWDVGHAPKDQGNRRKYMPDFAVWEIHPVMKIEVIQ
jgi:hypothetical protein